MASLYDAIPDMGACSGIPDIGAWQFVIPDGLRDGTFQSRPAVTGLIMNTSVATSKLGNRSVAESKFGADQS